jgi:hypothetical protein
MMYPETHARFQFVGDITKKDTRRRENIGDP